MHAPRAPGAAAQPQETEALRKHHLPAHSAHLAEGTGGAFPIHAHMLSRLPLQESFNATDFIIIYLLHQERK